MRPLLAAVVAATALLSPLPTPAHAAVTDPTGPLCGFVGFDGNVVFDAGPLNLADEDDPTSVHTGTVTCSITEGYAHSDPDWLSVTGAPGTGHAVLPPAPVPAPSEFPWNYRLCTELDVDGTTLYWHGAPGRNADGWWTADPGAPCEGNASTTDLRPTEDQPGGTVYSAAATAFGEVDTVACAVSCTGEASTMSSVSIARLPGVGALLRTAPYGWSCTDVHTGLAVVPGASLAVPDPGVACAPPVAPGSYCDRVEVSGVLLPAALGRVVVTDACGSLTVSRRLTPVQGTFAQPWSKNFGAANWPLRCTVDEDLASPADPAYAVSCAAFAANS